jgi:hypothetical protein
MQSAGWLDDYPILIIQTASPTTFAYKKGPCKLTSRISQLQRTLPLFDFFFSKPKLPLKFNLINLGSLLVSVDQHWSSVLIDHLLGNGGGKSSVGHRPVGDWWNEEDRIGR